MYVKPVHKFKQETQAKTVLYADQL